MTLAEVMIVLTLIALTLTLGVPALLPQREMQQLRAATNELRFSLNLARGRAAGMNELVGVDFAPEGLGPGDGFYVLYADLDRDGELDDGEADTLRLAGTVSRAGMRGFELPEGVEFGTPTGAETDPLGTPMAGDGVSFVDDRVLLLPDGTAGQSGHVALRTRSGRGYAVTLTAGGAVRSHYFDGAGWR